MNLNYLEWYVVELGKNLLGAVPLDKQNSLLHETKNHLSSLVEEFQSQGMDEKTSQLAAIDRFGTPEKIASQFLESMNSRQGRAFVTLLNLALFIAVCVIVTGLILLPNELIHGGPIMTIVPIALSYGIYTLLRGRRPSAKWLLLPTAMSVVIGLPSAYFLTAFTSYPGYLAQVIPYGALRKQVLGFRAEMQAQDKFLKPYMDSYRAALKDPKYKDGLKPGEKFSVPSYRHSNSKGIYVSFNNNGNSTQWVTKDPYHIQLQGSEFSIGSTKDRKPEVLAGPMTGHAFRQYFIEQLDSQRRGRSMDESALGQLEAGLNMSVFERSKLFAFWVAAATLLFGLPAAWIASWLAFIIRNSLRFRTRKIGLA
ncbi:MAG: hypothetical protein WCG75_06630 [Armatimonadota bacterium]